MILSDVEILNAIKRGEIVIDPFNPENLGPCSVDLTLSDVFIVFNKKNSNAILDPKDIESLRQNISIVKTNGKPFTIKPKQFILAYTHEKIAVSKNLAATLEGRSSIARLGIVVHAAGLVNPGTGMIKPKPIILEIFCQNIIPVKLYPGMRIVQILFHRLTSKASIGYDERSKSLFARSNLWFDHTAII